MPLRGLVLVAFFVASLPACFVRPFYGIVLWTIVAFLNPQSFTWSAASAFPWAMAVAIPTVLGMIASSSNWTNRILKGKLILLLVLWLWFTATTLISTHTPVFAHHAADTWFRWEFVSKVLIMTVATVAIVDSVARLRTLLVVIAASFGFYVLKALPFLVLTHGADRVYGPANSMISDNNDFGLALNMTLPIFFGLYQTESRLWLKRTFGLLFLGTVPAVFFTYSRGALVGLIAVLALMFIGMKRRAVLIPVIVLGCGIAVLFAPDSWKQRMNPDNAMDASAMERINAWTFSTNLFYEYPLTGGGFSTFTPELFSRYAPNALDIRGPHSVYFGVLAEHGIVGLLLYLALVIWCIVTTMRLARQARARDDSEIYFYAIALRFSLAGFLTSGIFLGRAYFDYYFCLVACITILERVAFERWAQDARDEEQIAEEQSAEEPSDVDLSWHGHSMGLEGGR